MIFMFFFVERTPIMFVGQCAYRIVQARCALQLLNSANEQLSVHSLEPLKKLARDSDGDNNSLFFWDTLDCVEAAYRQLESAGTAPDTTGATSLYNIEGAIRALRNIGKISRIVLFQWDQEIAKRNGIRLELLLFISGMEFVQTQ